MVCLLNGLTNDPILHECECLVLYAHTDPLIYLQIVSCHSEALMTDTWRWNCKVHESRVEVITKHPVFLNEDDGINMWLAVCQEVAIHFMAAHH